MKQTEGTETANVSFDLGAATMEYGNNAPYFTWGRKDPMVPSTGLSGSNKAIYGTYTYLSNMNTTDIAKTILAPQNFNTGYGPSKESWNVGNDASSVTKSIYDPSPAGFHLPHRGDLSRLQQKDRSYWDSTIGRCGGTQNN